MPRNSRSTDYMADRRHPARLHRARFGRRLLRAGAEWLFEPENQLPKLNTRVRFPSSAPDLAAETLFERVRTGPQCHDDVTRFKVTPAAFSASACECAYSRIVRLASLCPIHAAMTAHRHPRQVHQGGARVPGRVKPDVAHPSGLHGVTPVPRQHRGRIRLAGLVAHHIVERAAAQRQPLGGLPHLGSLQHRHQPIRQPTLTNKTASSSEPRQSRRAADPTAPAPKRAQVGRRQSRPGLRSPRLRCRCRPDCAARRHA
jgi:hypothetical protein